VSAPNGCKWLIAVEDGFAIELKFEMFNIDCSTGYLIVYDGQDGADGLAPLGTILGTFCDSSTIPTVLSSTGSHLYIEYKSTDGNNNFKATWSQKTIVCCNTITVSSTTQSVVDDWTGNKILGTFTYTAGDDINDRGIYRGNTDAYYAVKTVSAGFKAAWVASSTLLGTSPGDSSGLATESDHNAPKCPHYTTGSWSVFLQSTGSSVDDSTFTITCADSCSSTIPATPEGATVSWDNSVSAGTIITYTCSSGQKLYSTCGNDGQWSSPGACGTGSPSPSPSPPSPSPPSPSPSPTPPTSCTDKFYKNKFFKVKKKQIIGKSKTNKPAECLEKCKNEADCVGINWSKKKCFLLKGKLKLKKKKKFTAGRCV